MGENISEQLKLGVTLIVLSALLSMSANLFALSTDYLSNYVDTFVYTASSVEDDTLRDLNTLQFVGAPVVYKTLDAIIDSIDDLSITYKDGTVTSDHKTLLRYAASNVKVTVLASAGRYRVTVVEVDR